MLNDKFLKPEDKCLIPDDKFLDLDETYKAFCKITNVVNQHH